MRTSQAARYARWAAVAALLLTMTVAGVYARRAWQAAQVKKKAPPVVPPTVQQRSAEFSFSKVEQDRTLFTVRASRATEFKEGSRNLLEDVWITIYGRTGERFDNIHTSACEYTSNPERILCAGEVHMDLESAEDARQHPSQAPGENPLARVIHLRTSNVSFDRESGEARTDQPVIFRFPYGEGRSTGLSYSSLQGVVKLLRDVELTLAPPAGPESASAVRAANPSRSAAKSFPGTPVNVTAGSLEYRRDTRIVRLLAPVHARQGHRELLAGELALELDADLRARRMVARRGAKGAGQRPELRSAERRGQAVLRADECVAYFHREGWAERILATGSVRGNVHGPGGEDRLEAQELEVEMLPEFMAPKVLTARGDVKAQSSHRGESRSLATSALRFYFVDPTKPREQRLGHAETLAPATIEWQRPNAPGGNGEPQTIRLRGRQIAAEFGERNEFRNLTGRGDVEIERRLPGRPPQVSMSQELTLKFAPGSKWAELQQSGNVRLREADRSAQADHARLDRATDNLTLTGSVVLSDQGTRTTAESLTFNQHSGELRADGEVRSTETSAARNGVVNLAPQPAIIASDHLVANTSNGRAVYSGHARLWQGDAVIEADSIELLRGARQLIARGNVAAVFPQAEASAGSPTSASAVTKRPEGAGPAVWRVRAGTLTYWSAEARAHLEQNVLMQARQGQIGSRVLDLFFTSTGSPGGSPTSSRASGGAQRLSRAVASGGVTVRQGDRRGVAEQAEYIAAEGKFVLSGGHPTLYDTFRGTTTGRQLTFFFADDTIVVDSEEGSRTLTRHRVEK